jgi:hypothetical protein
MGKGWTLSIMTQFETSYEIFSAEPSENCPASFGTENNQQTTPQILGE